MGLPPSSIIIHLHRIFHEISSWGATMYGNLHLETNESNPVEPLTSAQRRLAGFGMAVLIGAAETIRVLHPEVAQPGNGSKA